MTMPDFNAMTAEQAAEWITNNDTTDLLRQARPAVPGKRWVLVDTEGTEVLRSTAIRMPASMLAELDEVAGSDREGRSGVVRRAVREYLDRLRRDSTQPA
ncbi:MAG TPA: ribbon-helix-helix domain-containing protein [Micromonosporaceae bacterium]|nr:ribbon-helix-helix domain-containing protein [Micromonosporaceae bacterium]